MHFQEISSNKLFIIVLLAAIGAQVLKSFIIYFSSIIVFISALALLFYIGYYFVNPSAPRGITTIIVLVLFLGGAQLLSISIIAEYIGKILEETKNRPKFIIDKIFNKKSGTPL